MFFFLIQFLYFTYEVLRSHISFNCFFLMILSFFNNIFQVDKHKMLYEYFQFDREQHELTHKIYECTKCKERCISSRSLKFHKARRKECRRQEDTSTEIKTEKRGMFHCRYCDLSSSVKSNISRHEMFNCKAKNQGIAIYKYIEYLLF